MSTIPSGLRYIECDATCAIHFHLVDIWHGLKFTNTRSEWIDIGSNYIWASDINSTFIFSYLGKLRHKYGKSWKHSWLWQLNLAYVHYLTSKWIFWFKVLLHKLNIVFIFDNLCAFKDEMIKFFIKFLKMFYNANLTYFINLNHVKI